MRRGNQYVVRHGTGFKFQMAVPLELRDAIGRRMWRRYIGARPEAEIRLYALQLAVELKRDIQLLRLGPRAARAEGDSARERLRNFHRLEGVKACQEQNGDTQPEPINGPVADGGVRLKSAQADHPTSVGVEFIDLVEVWRRVTLPRAARSIKRMRECAFEFVAVVDKRKASEVTREDVMQFRDAIEAKDLALSTARNYLQGVHRLFSIGLSEGLVTTNPAAGIAIRNRSGKFADRQRRRPFDLPDVKKIYGLLPLEPEPFEWMFKLLIYHGMRSGEAAQLRVDDITEVFGVPVLRVHDRYGSLKNIHSQRDIPLHPACLSILDHAKNAKGPWLFPQDTMRADRFQRSAGVFLRTKVCLLDKALTVHSLRHTWRTLAREVGMPIAVSRAIMGHSMGSDVHEGYGAGPSLRLRAEWMARIDPINECGRSFTAE